jgi:hypothetical protein
MKTIGMYLRNRKNSIKVYLHKQNLTLTQTHYCLSLINGIICENTL